jgi:hypothetical protein
MAELIAPAAGAEMTYVAVVVLHGSSKMQQGCIIFTWVERLNTMRSRGNSAHSRECYGVAVRRDILEFIELARC